MRNYWRGIAGLVLLLVCGFLSGCESASRARYNPAGMPAAPIQGPAEMSGYKLRRGDELNVTFPDMVPPVAPMIVRISEDGSITLIHNQRFEAAGKRIGELQTLIHDKYVPTYYKSLTVNVSSANQYYFVGGEVRGLGRQAYTGYMTVLGAIDTAGGFTEFARRGKVHVIRADGKQITLDATKALRDPDLNVEIFPNDKIDVPKRVW